MAKYNRHYLKPYAPDILFSLPGLAGHALAKCIFGVMELKYCKDEDPRKNTNLGQLYDYLLKLRKHQPYRSHFFGILSNTREKNVMCPVVRKYNSISCENIIRFLIDNIGSHKPRELPFSLDTHHLWRVLGVSRRSCVAVFKCSVYTTSDMAVKGAYGSHQANIQHGLVTLRKLGSHSHENLPQLVYSGPKDKQFGMTPVGEPLGMHRFATAKQLRGVLKRIRAERYYQWPRVSPQSWHCPSGYPPRQYHYQAPNCGHH